MKKYCVILTESGEDTICGRYDRLEDAKQHLQSVRYWPEYRRTMESLDIADDGMSGTGFDETGEFTYTIKTEVA